MKKFLVFLISVSLLSACGNPYPSDSVKPEIPASRVILALGDSLTAGYGLPIEQSYPSQLQALLQKNGYPYSVQNAGISGDVSAELLSRLDWILDGFGKELPALAIVEVGGNDAFQAIPPSELEKNLDAIVSKLQARKIPILLTGMKAPLNLGTQYRSEFEAIFPRIAERRKVPMMNFFLEWVATIPQLNLSDGIHPNQAWYAIISDNILRELEKNRLIQK